MWFVSVQGWRRIRVLPQHLDLTKEFPANFTFVVLQHSPDRLDEGVV